MSAKHTVVLTCYEKDWTEFVENFVGNEFAEKANERYYENSDIMNVKWEWIDWFSNADAGDMLDFFTNRSYILTTLDENHGIEQDDNIIDEEEDSVFWDYAPIVDLNINF